jgi:hypothetical protein
LLGAWGGLEHGEGVGTLKILLDPMSNGHHTIEEIGYVLEVVGLNPGI